MQNARARKMDKQFKVGDVVEWQALDEAGTPVGDPLVVRYTAEGKVVDRPRSGSGGSNSFSEEETQPMEMTVPVNPLAEALGRLLPLAEKWLEKQVGEVEAEKPTGDPKFLTPEEASIMLHLHVQTVMKMCREGKIDAVKNGGNAHNGMGGKWLIPREAIDGYLHKQRVIHGQRRRPAK
jgi:excisionase family DNA binding protein